ncbi:MAG: FkbM family methyltransferase [Acidobacteria bacterium]|nr:FkbM family methyltransferase [Acidobacteriota bacterium]MBI3656034.1 FkbM family methyltransferase [Acidobacteriota bacterium]
MTSINNKLVSQLLGSYYRGPDFPMKLRLWDWLRKGLKYSRLTVSYGKNGWISVDERDLLQRQILATGTYEMEVWETLAARATSCEVVWDVGAHIGSVAIRALMDARVKEVHAFEPDPRHSEILAINLALNQGLYTIHRLALGSRCGAMKLYRGPLANTGLSSLVAPPEADREEFTVNCRTADELVFRDGITPPTLMKIDVEDWEYAVLIGAKRVLRASPPKAIVFESRSDPHGEILDRRLIDYLKDVGYRVQRIRRPSGIVDVRENYLAIRVGSKAEVDEQGER